MDTFGSGTEVGKAAKPLRESLSIPPLVILNIIILTLCGIFVWSDQANLAYLQLAVLKDDQDVYFESFFLSITDSLSNLWDGDSYALASAICILSVLLPFVILTLLLAFIWIGINNKTRKSMLHVVDLMAKLPVLGIFYLICATNILQQDIDFTLLQVDYIGYITIELEYGIVLFLLAIIALMMVTVILNFYHNRDLYENHRKPREFQTWSKCNQPLLFYPRIDGKKLAAVITLVASFGCLCGCYSSAFFTVQFLDGMADYMAHPVRTYSIIDIGMFNSYSTAGQSSSTLVLLSVVYCFLVVFMPLLLVVTLMVLWFIPMPKRCLPHRIRFFVWCLHCWSGLEVIFVVICLLIFEMPYLYNHLLFEQYGSYCDYYMEYLETNCPLVSVESDAGLWLCMVSILGINVSVYYTVFVSYRDDEPILNDEQYLMGNSERQPLNSGLMDRDASPIAIHGGHQRKLSDDDDDEQEEVDQPYAAFSNLV